MVRWRIQRVSVSPQEAGLCGCWQFLVVWRQRQELRQDQIVETSEEHAFYCTSAAPKQYSARRQGRSFAGEASEVRLYQVLR